jgi:hypothetical protein
MFLMLQIKWSTIDFILNNLMYNIVSLEIRDNLLLNLLNKTIVLSINILDSDQQFFDIWAEYEKKASLIWIPNT